jgi:hypothetical protein
VEQALADHVRRGEWLDLAGEDEVVDEAAMRSWGDARACRATVIRDILRGRLVADPTRVGCGFGGSRSPVGLIWKTSRRKSTLN